MGRKRSLWLKKQIVENATRNNAAGSVEHIKRGKADIRAFPFFELGVPLPYQGNRYPRSLYGI
jgi:hypothetical protein